VGWQFIRSYGGPLFLVGYKMSSSQNTAAAVFKERYPYKDTNRNPLCPHLNWRWPSFSYCWLPRVTNIEILCLEVLLRGYYMVSIFQNFFRSWIMTKISEFQISRGEKKIKFKWCKSNTSDLKTSFPSLSNFRQMAFPGWYITWKTLSWNGEK
jgi:hypothetical protein